jgi:hypothetical protein
MKAYTAISELTGEPVSTCSDEWRHECELRYVLGLSPADRDAFFNGVKDSGNRGIVALRGVAGGRTVQGRPGAVAGDPNGAEESLTMDATSL